MVALDGFWQVRKRERQLYLKLKLIYLIKTDAQNINMSEKGDKYNLQKTV